MKQAIILAGGKGTRLQGRLHGLPKPLVDICGKPLLERQVESLKSYGFNQVLILVNHGADQIIQFCDSKDNWNIDIQCLDDGQPLGTAGATIQIFTKLADEFLVVYGDTMFDIDLARFQAFHDEDKSAGATLFLHPNDHPQDSDLVAMDGQCRITGFYPYPHDPKVYLPNLVNAGMYYFRKDALKSWVGGAAALDFGKDIFPALIRQGVLLRGYNSPEYIKDCGTPKRLDKVSAHYESGLIASSNLRFKQNLIFLDRDGTINQSVDQLAKADDFELLPGVAQAIAQINHAGYRAVVVTNQPVLARGECTPEELENIHRKMQTLLGEYGAYLDRIYYCPHHPDSGFAGEVVALKQVCDCRKPAIGMLTLAQKELNADLGASWMIGDSTADVLAAQAAGVRSILLETGNAGLDEKYPVLPDHISPNLPAAVHYILHDHPRLLKQCESWSQNIAPGDLVFIGGLSRSGKSTLAHCLQEALRINGKTAHILSADGWLKAPEHRGQTVIERFDMNALNQLAQSLVNRKQDLTLQVPIYSKRELKGNRTIEKVIGPQDVVIIEGTIALLLEVAKANASVHSWYVQIDELQRKKRLLTEYGLRGRSTEDAQQIYAQRQIDEARLIELAKAHASCCINLDLTDDLT
jgi:histidinol-phosphate phosphatase family protein